MSSPLVEVVIAGNSESYVASINSAADTTEDAVGRLDEASKGMSESFEASSASADSLAGGITSVGGSADDAAGMVEDASASIKGSLADILPQTEDLDAGITGIGESFDRTADMVSVDTTLMMADIDKLIESTDEVIASVDETGDTIDEVSSSSNGFLSTIGDMLESLSGKFGLVGEAAAKMGESINESCDVADESLDSTSDAADATAGSMSAIGKGTILAFAVVAAASIDLGSKYQALTTNIAAWGGISVGAATKITNAFLGTAGSTIYSAKEIATAYGSVVGQLTAAQGHTLNASQAMVVMNNAMDLAEGSGESLSTATSALSTVMQTYKLKTSDATDASDALFSTAKGTGTSLGAVAKSVQQVHTQLGALTPPLGQAGALMVDMVNNGMNGSRALRVLGSSLNSLLKPGENVINDQQNLKTTLDALPPSLQKLAKEYENGTISTSALSTQTQALSTTQSALWGHFTSAYTALDGANLKLKESGDSALFVNGKFIGLGNAIGVLHDQTKGLTKEQQLAKLSQDGLASSAAKLLPIVDAGTKAFDKASAEVNKNGAAHDAAAKQAQTLDHQLDALKVMVDDYVTELGTKLVPILTVVAKGTLDVINFLVHNKEVILIVGGAIIASLVPAFITWASTAAAAAVATIAATWPILLIGAAIGGLIYGIIELVGHWGEVWGEIKSIADDAWHFIDDNIIHPIEEGFDWVVNEIKSHWQGLLEILIAPFAPVLAIVLAFHNQIIHFFEDIPHYVMTVVNAIVGFFTAMPGEIVAGVGDLVQTIFGPLSAAAGWVMSNVIDPVVSFFVQLPNKILSGLGNIVGFIFNPLLQAQSWVLNNVINPVVNWFMQLPNHARAGLGDIIGDIFGGLLDIGSWIDSNVISPFVHIIEGIPGDLGNIGGMLVSAGEQIIQGLWNGIGSMAGWLGSQIGNFIKSNVVGVVKSVLSIFSPSQVMAGHGLNVALGLAQGILSGSGAVAAASKTIAMAAQSGVTGGGLGISVGAASALGSGSAGSSGSAGAPITLVLSIDGERFAQAVLNPLQSANLRNQKTGGQFTVNLT